VSGVFWLASYLSLLGFKTGILEKIIPDQENTARKVQILKILYLSGYFYVI